MPSHQDFQGFPQLDTPAIDLATGAWTPPWYRVLISLWQKLGGSKSSLPASTFLQQAGTSVVAFNALDGSQIGSGPLAFGKVNGLAMETLLVGASPATLVATSSGTLVISGGGQVEISRPPGPFILASLVGGVLPVIGGDSVRLTYFSGPAPTAHFFPFSIS